MSNLPQMTVEDWLAEQRRLEDQMTAVARSLQDHKHRCSHKFSNGETTLSPTGYGDAQCRACKTQTD